MAFRLTFWAGLFWIAVINWVFCADKSVEKQVTALSDEGFEQRRAAEAGLRSAICAGSSEEVREALQSALKAENAGEELKHRAIPLLDACVGGVIVGDLRACLLAEPADKDGGLAFAPDDQGLPKIVLRITNVGNKEVQVPRSSYACYRFFKLRVTRVCEDGKRESVRAYSDLYPEKDMIMPNRVYEILLPGGYVERDMDTLLRQGFLLQTLSASGSLPENLEKDGFGAMRKFGTYEVTGRYATSPTDMSGKPCDVFEADVGRKSEIPLWEGPEVTSQTVVLKVRGK